MDFSNDEFNALAVGQCYFVRGFVSATARPACAFAKDTLVIIKIHRNSPTTKYGVAHIAHFSAFYEETEHLITSKAVFRVMKKGPINELRDKIEVKLEEHNNEIAAYNLALPAFKQAHQNSPKEVMQPLTLSDKKWQKYIMLDFVEATRGRVKLCRKHENHEEAILFPQLHATCKKAH